MVASSLSPLRFPGRRSHRQSGLFARSHRSGFYYHASVSGWLFCGASKFIVEVGLKGGAKSRGLNVSGAAQQNAAPDVAAASGLQLRKCPQLGGNAGELGR